MVTQAVSGRAKFDHMKSDPREHVLKHYVSLKWKVSLESLYKAMEGKTSKQSSLYIFYEKYSFLKYIKTFNKVINIDTSSSLEKREWIWLGNLRRNTNILKHINVLTNQENMNFKNEVLFCSAKCHSLKEDY